MTELGLFGADEDQDKCVREKPGDYCMKSGKFVNKRLCNLVLLASGLHYEINILYCTIVLYSHKLWKSRKT